MWLARGLSRVLCCGRREEGQAPLLLELDTDASGFEAMYELGSKIGEGTFGKVFTCRPSCGMHPNISTQYELCVKVVATKGRHPARVANLPDADKLELIKLFNQMQHPNIVQHHRFVQTREALYVVMSQCQGPDLVDHMEALGEQLSMGSVCDISRQILRALEVVHCLGMMHRDIKPENFRFRDPAATMLQLLDFGAATLTDDTARSHSVTGTLLYAAPEVFDGFYGRSCDLWSAGVVMFFLISGQLPFVTSDVTMLRSMHRDPVLTGDCLFRGERWRKAPSGAKHLVRGLLTVDAESRLTATAALEHRWLATAASNGQSEEDWEAAGSAKELPSLFRNNSNIDLTDLKRSYFVWNLAECGGAEDTDNDEAQVFPLLSGQVVECPTESLSKAEY